jgi:hypothetical protein
MSNNVELVTYGSEEQANKIVKDIPVTHRNISTIDAFKGYIANLFPYVFFIILILNPRNEILNQILEETKKKENQKIDVLICGTPNDNLTTNSMRTTFVNELAVKYKIEATIARFLDEESTNQSKRGNIDLAIALDRNRTKILEQLHTDDKVFVDF